MYLKIKTYLMKKTNYFFKKQSCFLILLFSIIVNSGLAQNPGLIISEFHVNPAGNDSPFEYLELKASKYIDFSITPYSVVVCNNGTAASSGWVSGGVLSYGFNINTGIVNIGDVVYVGGSSMAPLGVKIRTINTATVNGDGFGAFALSGVFGNGGANADGIAVFNSDISTLTNSTVPVDAVFYGTSIGTATTAVGGYQLPINDLYIGGKLLSSSFLASDPGALNLIATGSFNTSTNTYATVRSWTIGTLTDGTSSITLTNTPPPANLAFSVDNQNVLESVGTLTASIDISSSNTLASSVEVVVIPFGTATNGSDYAFATYTVNFPPSSTGSLPVTISITDDLLPEAAEYLVIKLQNPVNATIGLINQQTIHIRDNENSTPIGNSEINMSFISSFSNGAFATNSAEIVAHDPISQKLFVANSIGRKLDIINFSNPASMTLISSIDISPYGNINSVAVKNGIVACAIENNIPELNGSVVFFNTSGVYQNSVTVGALPDMVIFNHAGTKVLTANEGQPNSTYTIDPEGSVSIINISGGIATLTGTNVTTAFFTAFNSQIATLKANGVRIYGPGSTVAQDMEPEYITISENDSIAYITLQENNAIAYVNLTTNSITAIKALGFKDHSALNSGLDATNTGTNINIANWPIKGMYQPDAISHFNVGGSEYLITANEGDARADYGAANNEETTIGAATYSLDPVVFPYASVMKTNANLGKLKCTNKSGDSDGDGDFDEIYAFGGRSFSIWNSTTGSLVYDSGDDLEQITAGDLTYGAIFNSSTTNIIKKDRSDDKGPEPEGVTTAVIAGKVYAFVSMERVGGLMVFNVTNPATPQFIQYVNNRGLIGLTGDRGPEGIIYIKQQDSPNSKSLIVLGNEVSSTVSVYEISCPSVTATLTTVGSLTTCVGNTVAINTNTLAGATYVWFNGSVSIPTATLSTYTTTSSGNYSVKLNNVGCTILSNSVTTIFNPLPIVTVNSGSICSGNSFTIVPSGAATYTYSSVSAIVSPTANTSYTVTGTSALGCIGLSGAVSSLTVNALPVVTVNSGSICSGNSFTMVPAGASTYTYSGGSAIVSPTANTNYSVTGTNTLGCISNIAAISTVTVNSIPTVTATTTNSLICVGGNALLTASTTATSYSWSNGTTGSTTIVTPVATTIYTLIVNSIYGCSASSTVIVNVNTCTSIEESNSLNDLITIYPNPNIGIFNLELTNSSTIIISNSLGQILFNEIIEKGKQTIDIRNQTSGLYFVKIIQNYKEQSVKIIKE